MTLTCGCSPTHGQECGQCNGFDADRGVPAPTPRLPTAEAWDIAQLALDQDPWRIPNSITEPF